MAIRHLVLFKIRGDSESERDQLRQELSELLESLRVSVPVVMDLQVHQNAGDHPLNWDIAFTTDFADVEELARYRDHPEHLKIVDVLDHYVSERAALDYSI